jgi:hypothetical protein
MSTALTAFFTNAVASLATANKLYSLSGSPTLATASSAIGTSTGWGEMFSQGNATTWANAGSEPSQSGHGWLLDSTVLEGQQFSAANWSGKIGVKTNSVTVTPTVVFRLRAAKRTSGGVYTLIVDIPATATALSNSESIISFPSTLGSAVSFSTGDKLYIDIPSDITVAASLSGNLILTRLSTDTSGLTGDPNGAMITPGYSPAGGATKLRISDGYGGLFS